MNQRDSIIIERESKIMNLISEERLVEGSKRIKIGRITIRAYMNDKEFINATEQERSVVLNQYLRDKDCKVIYKFTNNQVYLALEESTHYHELPKFYVLPILLETGEKLFMKYDDFLRLRKLYQTLIIKRFITL